jgi:hypothetical protein
MPRRPHDDSDRDDRRHPKRRPADRTRKSSRLSIGLVVGLAIGGGLLAFGGVAVAALIWPKKAAPAIQNDQFPGMLAYWSFDKVRPNSDETTTIIDETGRGNDGRMVAGRLAPGRKGNALWLDGRDDQYVDVSTAKDLQQFAPQSELTIAAWFLAEERFAGTIVAFHHPTFPTMLDIFVRDGRVIGLIRDDQVMSMEAFVWSEQRKDPPPTAADGRWHHVALTRRERIVELFYDGVSQGIDAKGNSGGRLSGGEGAIGCHLGFVRNRVLNFGRPGFKGAIDEVYVFSRSLKQHEIQALMNR